MIQQLTDWRRLHGSVFENQRVLVTGGAGFIGSHLTYALHELGAEVTVLDDLTGGGDPAVLPKKVSFHAGSILNKELLGQCTQGRAFVFHQAAMGSVPASVRSPHAFYEANSTGTLNVLETAREAGIKRVMFAASSSAYGDSPKLPKVETMPALPRSPYAATKVAGEAYLASWSASYGLDTVSLRYFNIFGPRQSADNAYAAVIAAFAKAYLRGRHPIIYGDGEQSRDFTFVDNAVHANLLAAQAKAPIEGTIVNVACGERVTITELASLMAELSGNSGLKPMYMEERTGDVKHSVADLSRAKEILNYTPVVKFREGLAATMEWYKVSMGGP